MHPGKFSAIDPDRLAVIMEGSHETLSYGELEERSVRLARVLRERGLRPGDGVALISPNHVNCFVAYWAAVRSGLYITVVNFHLTPAETKPVLDNCEPRALIASAECGALAESVADAGSVRVWLSFDGSVPGAAGHWEDLDTALAGVSSEPLEDQPKGMDMLYSSGTTGGTPKGIRPPLPGTPVDAPGDYAVDTFAKVWDMGQDTVYLSPAPLYHGGPLRFAILMQKIGGTVIVMRKFEAERALAAIQEFRCTHSQWVPTMFVRMLKLPEKVRTSYDVSSMRYAIHASAPCPPQVKRKMIDWWGPVLVEYYSSQEAAGITLISTDEWLSHPGSVGRAVLGEIKICGISGSELPAGGVGTVYFARDHLPFVYHKNPEATREAQHPVHPSWTTPGDVGYLDEDGYLYLTDRAKFMIISGGVNIYPQEIENQLTLHPAVHDVAVIGAPDDDIGEIVVAIVHPAPGYDPGPELEQEFRRALSASLASFKVPRIFRFVDELPRTATGKLAKMSLINDLRENRHPATA